MLNAYQNNLVGKSPNSQNSSISPNLKHNTNSHNLKHNI